MTKAVRVKQIVSILLILVIMFAPIGVFSNDSYAENNKDAENIQLTIPETSGRYVIMSPKKPGANEPVLVESNESNVYLSNEPEASGKELVEENISFNASSEDDICWITQDDMDSISDECDFDWNYDMINVEPADTDTIGDAIDGDNSKDKIKVAVMDSGVDYIADTNLKSAVNLVETEQDIEDSLCDMTGHGTSVASIISKIDPDAELYSVRVLDRNNKGTLARVVQGIYWCIDNNINIINMSFGTNGKSQILQKAVKDAEDHGIIMISAAGNDPHESIEYPAAFDEVMSVGSINPDGTKSSQNAEGSVDVFAPGEAVVTQSMLGLCTEVRGTSVAAPHVAAAASTLLEKNPDKTADFIKGLISASSNRIDNEYAVIDVSNAENIYDDYAGNPDEVSVNTNGLNTYDGEIKANWGPEGSDNQHHMLVDQGKYLLKKDKNVDWGFTTDEVTALKKGAVYPDKGHLSHEYAHGRRTRNWIASYKYLTAVAKEMRSSKTSSQFSVPRLCDVIGSGDFTDEVSIIKQDIKFNGVYYNSVEKEPNKKNEPGEWSTWYNTNNTIRSWSNDLLLKDLYTKYQSNATELAKLKSMFIYGIALHTMTDAFAHATYADKDGKIKIVHKNYYDTHYKTNPNIRKDAHSRTDYPNRWRDASYASKELVVHIMQNKEGQIKDFYPNDYRVYLDKNKTTSYGSRGYYLHKPTSKANAIKGANQTNNTNAFKYINCSPANSSDEE